MSAIELQPTLIKCLIYNNICVIFRDVGHHFYQLFHNTVLIKVRPTITQAVNKPTNCFGSKTESKHTWNIISNSPFHRTTVWGISIESKVVCLPTVMDVDKLTAWLIILPWTFIFSAKCRGGRASQHAEHHATRGAGWGELQTIIG